LQPAEEAPIKPKGAVRGRHPLPDHSDGEVPIDEIVEAETASASRNTVRGR
jgi:hypothetical protein